MTMTVGSVSTPVQPQQTSRSLQPQPATESPAHEAEETPAVTAQEAAKGDTVAQRKLAAEEAAQAASGESGQSPAGNGRLVRAIA